MSKREESLLKEYKIRSMKDIYGLIEECSYRTGYSIEDINDCIDELIEDGSGIMEATVDAIEIAYEQDL